MALQAHLRRLQDADRRSAARRKLSLGSTLGQAEPEVLIHDLSTTGMLIETSADLGVGEPLEVDIPEAGPSQAVVVWGHGRLFGCEFKTPIPMAAVSAALLRSDFVADRGQLSAGAPNGARGDPAAARPLGAGEPLPSAVLWLVVALLAGALGYFLLTGDVWAPLVTAAVAGLIVAILVAMGVGVQNDADF